MKTSHNLKMKSQKKFSSLKLNNPTNFKELTLEQLEVLRLKNTAIPASKYGLEVVCSGSKVGSM